MDIRTLELIARPVEAVQFTDSNVNELREWVQENLAFHNVSATAERFYLPAVGGTEILVPGDWIFRYPIDNTFKGATDKAVKTHYLDITEEK